MAGPRYEANPDRDYVRRLKEENDETWYGRLCKAAMPRGFSRMDNLGGPTAGDLIVVPWGIHQRAVAAVAAIDRGEDPDRHDLDALGVIVHEHTHCLVEYIEGTTTPRPDHLRRYSHPDKALAAIRHACGPDCRFGLNAFTGILRWRNQPPEAWEKGVAWFRQHLAARPTPYRSTQPASAQARGGSMAPRRRDGVMGRRFVRNTAFYVMLALVAAFFSAATLYTLIERGGEGFTTPFGPVGGAPDAVEQEPDPDLRAADLDVRLTQLGSDQPFRGTGTPGLYVAVAGGTWTDWELEGWANHTVTQGLTICESTTVHYTPYDWVYQFDADAGRGFYQTIASTVLQRMGTDGDQCLPRFGATGQWTFYVCFESDGERAAPHRDAQGRLHTDPWDRCEEGTMEVEAGPQGFVERVGQPWAPPSQAFSSAFALDVLRGGPA